MACTSPTAALSPGTGANPLANAAPESTRSPARESGTADEAEEGAEEGALGTARPMLVRERFSARKNDIVVDLRSMYEIQAIVAREESRT